MSLLIPVGCTWTPGREVLTVDEYRTLEERWSEERERRLKALLDERFEALREQDDRLRTLERRTEGILAGLRELEAEQRRANRNDRGVDSDAEDPGDDGEGEDGGTSGDAGGSEDAGGGDDDPDASDAEEGAGDNGDSRDVDLEREPDVLASGEPLVFGSKECIGLPEQGLVLRARVDSGANTASLGAIDIREFERDGDPWVRFRIPYKGLGEDGIAGMDDGDGEDGDDDVFDEVVEAVDGESGNAEAVGVRVEARVSRRVTIVQASGEEERVVVRLPTRIGPFEQRVEYTLADRGGMTFPVLLGRRLLRDLAMVDVARDYVQPCPPN